MLEDISNINSELRYITVELMKIASQRNASFESVAKEFLSNAYILHEMIEKERKKSR